MYYCKAANITAAVTLTTTAETAVVTTPAPDERLPVGGGVLVSGYVNVTAGTGTTAVVVKVRAGAGTTGTVLQSSTHTLAAGASANIPVDLPDFTATAPVGQYTVTVAQTGATANGSATGALSAQPVDEDW